MTTKTSYSPANGGTPQLPEKRFGKVDASKTNIKDQFDGTGNMNLMAETHRSCAGQHILSVNSCMKEFTSEIQSMPAPPPRVEYRYDHRGRVLKSSVHNDCGVGAYAMAGPAPFDCRRNGLPLRGTTLNINNNDREPPIGNDENETQEKEEIGVPEENDSLWWKKRTFSFIVTGFMSVLAVSVVVTVLLLTGGSSEDPVELCVHPEDVTSQDLVPNLTGSTRLALEDPHSIQYQAYDWISREDQWEFYEDWRKQQRFAMACVHYAFGGGQSVDWFLYRTHHASHECDWNPVLDLCPNEDGIVTTLSHQRPTRHTAFFPPELALFPNLEVLDFYETRWSRPLEDMFLLNTTSNLPLLRELRLVDGELKGSIPSSLGLLARLEHLNLSNNKLSSTIPSQLGLLSNLQTLVLSSNNLSGSIPKELTALSTLILIDVEGNPDM